MSNPVISESDWVCRKGKNAAIIPIALQDVHIDVKDARQYYIDIFKSAAFNKLIIQYCRYL